MNIGIPKEIKTHEYRVSLTPKAVKTLVDSGNRVLVEQNAGLGSGFSDEEYTGNGAVIVSSPEELYSGSELIVKVKEPQEEEYSYIRSDHKLFCYLHLAADKQLTDTLLEKGTTAVSFETVQLADGSLPLLIPMSRVAGILASHISANLLHRDKGGKGKLIGGLPGVKPAKVLIVGGGTVGYNACFTALGMKSEVTVVDINTSKLNFFYENFKGRVKTLPSYPELIMNECRDTDILIGAVLVPGALSPKVINREHIKAMKPGSVFFDVAIDQGGSGETSSPTNHENPTYMVDDIIHYCVTNVPSLVSDSSTKYLSNEILPYVLMIAGGRLETSEALKKGINTKNGKLLIDI